MRMISSALRYIADVIDSWNLPARVAPGGDWTVWLVQSSRRKDGKEPLEHRVDLLDYRLPNGGFNGSCNCEHFVFTLDPRVEESIETGVPLRCKHIRRVRGLVVDAVLEKEWRERNWRTKERK